jgi:hypothetical protein
MNCDNVRQMLSAFHDGELPAPANHDVEQHLSTCVECRQKLESMARIGQVARTLIDPGPSVDLWPQIVAQMSDVARSRNDGKRGWLTNRLMAVAALAVGVMLIVGIGVWQGWFSPTEEQRMARIFDRYLKDFAVSPLKAQNMLDRAFPPMSVEQSENSTVASTSMVGLREKMPGLTRVAMHVRNLPCCDCVQGLYQRDDGTYVTVFEHEMPSSWDASSKGREVQCGDCVCRLRQLDSRLAATWTHDARYFTVIGVTGEDELKQIVEQLDPSEVNQVAPHPPASES